MREANTIGQQGRGRRPRPGGRRTSRRRSSGCASRCRTLSDRATSVFVVSAPSGAGKSTVLGRVLKEVGADPLLRVPHHAASRGTTRGKASTTTSWTTPRSRALRDQNKMLEWAQVHGQLYGTGLAELERAGREGVDLLLDIDVQGADQVRKKLAGRRHHLHPPSVVRGAGAAAPRPGARLEHRRSGSAWTRRARRWATTASTTTRS